MTNIPQSGINELGKIGVANYLNNTPVINPVMSPSMQNVAFNIPREAYNQIRVDDIDISNEAADLDESNYQSGFGFYFGGEGKEAYPLGVLNPQAGSYVRIWTFLAFIWRMISACFKWLLKVLGFYKTGPADAGSDF